VDQALRQQFKPEFRNRVDRVIHFKPLLMNDLKEIAHRLTRQLEQQVSQNRQIILKLTPEVIGYLCEKGFDPLNGARPLKRVLDQLVQQPLGELLLSGRATAGDTVSIRVADSALRFDVQHP